MLPTTVLTDRFKGSGFTFSTQPRPPANGAVPKVMSVALIELVEMTATLNVVVSINSTTALQTYWTASFCMENYLHECSFAKILLSKQKRPDNPKHKFRLHTVAAFRLWRGFEEYFERHLANVVKINFMARFVNTGSNCCVRQWSHAQAATAGENEQSE